MNFRYDINGLRAIAVIAVVIFHFNPTWVPGGFAGVDVFFVISGFLMTGIIFKGLENNDFKLFNFYTARANRIIPALAVLCLVLLTVGWFFLTPIDYKPLIKHVASSISFVSNFIYWKEAGYFDVSSHEKWLLHTWSLSVEWQFYILYPIVLLVLKSFLSISNLKRLVVIGTVFGFIVSVYATTKWPTGAYYLFPTRAWEMMLGGVAFLYPWHITDSKRKITEWLGLALIISAYALISGGNAWPGYLAAIPVIGAYLMISANQQSSIVTNNIIFQYIGKWSYSIYLWHWPVVVLEHYLGFENWIVYGIFISITLGFLSFKFIESFKFSSLKKPTLIIFMISKPMIIFYCVFLTSLVLQSTSTQKLMPTYGSEAHLYMDRYRSEEVETLRHSYEYFADECNFFDYFSGTFEVVRDSVSPRCLNFDHNKPNVFIWGDSHAQAIGQAIKEDDSLNVSQVASSSCKAEFGHEYNKVLRGVRGEACKVSNKYVLSKLKLIKPDIVIVAQHDKHEKSDFEQLAINLKQLGVGALFVVGPTPQWSDLPVVISRTYMDKAITMLPKKGMAQSILATDKIMLSKAHKNYTYVSILDRLCNSDKCLGKIDDQNSALLFDDGHLTKEGSYYLYNLFLKEELYKLIEENH
ncbi:acyltransferase family protein [Vibrio sp. WJH972]